jgi:hypothetical protein
MRNESEIDILDQQRAGITALVDYQSHLPRLSLSNDASLHKT